MARNPAPINKGKYNQGMYHPSNPDKLMIRGPFVYRSSWELTVMRKFDSHPNVAKWAAEPFPIAYINPLTGKPARYYPDFAVIYMDKDGKTHKELLEVKPLKETLQEAARTKKSKELFLLNQAKWAAATKWCMQNGYYFRKITEKDIFGIKRK